LVNLPYRLCRKQKNLQKRRIIEIKVLFTGKTGASGKAYLITIGIKQG